MYGNVCLALYMMYVSNDSYNLQGLNFSLINSSSIKPIDWWFIIIKWELSGFFQGSADIGSNLQLAETFRLSG